MITPAQYGKAALIGVSATLAMVAIAAISGLRIVAVPLLIGAFPAALIFHEGIHSDHAIAYMMLAGLIDSTLFGAIALANIKTAKD